MSATSNSINPQHNAAIIAFLAQTEPPALAPPTPEPPPQPDPYAKVPVLLQDPPNWVVWRLDPQKGKVPYDAKTNRNAKVNDPSTWTTFKQAVEVASDPLNDYDGIGFMLQGTDLVGIDFDGVLQPDGAAEPFVLNILEKLGNPYCEVTPSGKGLRAFVQCPSLPQGQRKFSGNQYGAEIYSGAEGGRYLTVTGNQFSGNGVPKIANIDLAYFMVSQIRNDKLKRLWMGNISDFGEDQSRADQSLCNLIALLVNHNPQQVEAVFGASKLGQREKWTGRKDYRDRTIKKAISGEEPQKENNAQTADNSSTRTLTLIRGDQIKMRKVPWLWKGRLVAEGLNSFSGEPGTGKSTTSIDIIAAITRGRDFPDGAINEFGPKAVLIICDEDGREDVIVPRLTLAGADMTDIWFQDIEIHQGQTVEQAGARLDKDLPLIEEKLREHPEIVLIVPDPVTEYFGNANPNLDQEVGPIYIKMVQVSKRHHVAWLLISHFSKDRQATSTNRNSGAKVMVTKPRCNWLFAADPNSTDGRCLMLQGKCNLAKRKALAYYIETQNVVIEGDSIPLVLEDITRIRWDGETDNQADDVLLSMSDPKERADTKIKAFLDDVLVEGPRRAHECYKLGEAQSISEGSIQHHYRGIAKMQIPAPDGKNEWWWAKTKLELEELRKQLTSSQTAESHPSDDGVLAFLDGIIGDASMPVSLLKAAARTRGLNWETVRKSHQRRGYESITTDQGRCWRKVVPTSGRVNLAVVEGEDANAI